MKTKTLRSLMLTPAILLLLTTLFSCLLFSPAVNAQRTVKSDSAGKCPGGYIKLGVGVGEGGEDCIERDNADPQDNPIFIYLRNIVRFIGAGVGMALVLLIIIAGIRWTTSSGNPQALASAQKLLFAAVAGLVVFIFSVALLNFLIPGGIIGL